MENPVCKMDETCRQTNAFFIPASFSIHVVEKKITETFSVGGVE